MHCRLDSTALDTQQQVQEVLHMLQAGSVLADRAGAAQQPAAAAAGLPGTNPGENSI
jgi:hypothetical protein